jgi:hypothetical protein
MNSIREVGGEDYDPRRARPSLICLLVPHNPVESVDYIHKVSGLQPSNFPGQSSDPPC